MNWLGSNLLKTLWKPVISPVRTRYHAEKTRLVRRYGYEEVIWSGGLLPRVVSGTKLPMPEYRPGNPWSERKALFGQNDYIDILGSGAVHPVKTLYNVPSWIRAFGGNEYQMLLRKKKFWAKKGAHIRQPTKWMHLEKRTRFLYKFLNRYTKNGMSPI